MSGLWDGQSGLWGGSPGLTDGVSGLWSGASGFVNGGGGSGPVSPAVAYIAAMTVPPSAPLASRITTLIDGLVADGIWVKLDWLSLFAQQETVQAAKLNAVNPTQIFAEVLAPVFTTGPTGGFTGNGTTQYLDSNFNLLSAPSPKFGQNSAHLGAWLGTDVLVPLAFDAGTTNTRVNPSNAGTAQSRCNGAANTTLASATSLGHILTNRADAANQSISRNGAAFTTNAVASVAPDNATVFALAYNAAGVATSPSTRRNMAVHWGSGLTQTEATNLYNRLNTYMTAAIGFSADFNTANLVYSEEDRLVVRTDAVQRRAVRSLTGHTTGKWYAEILPLIARLRFGGIVDGTFTTNGAGGPAGENRVGVEAMNLVFHPSSSLPMGFVQAGTILRIAYDADAKLIWIRLGVGNWNGDPLADPETSVGGRSAAGLVGPAFIGATLRPISGAGVRYRLPSDPGYTLPATFSEWTGS